MKSKKIFVIIMAICLFFIAGCGNINSNLKLEKTEKTAASFYYDFIDEAVFMSEVGKQKLLSDGIDEEYEFLSFINLFVIEYGYSLISAMDYCINVAENPGDSSMSQGIYEYGSDYAQIIDSNGKLIVIVSKAVGKNNVFTSTVYYAEPNQTLSDLKDGAVEGIDYSYTISRNRSEGIYEFSDSAKDISGSFAYDKAQGHMTIQLSYKLSSIGQTVNVEMNLYNYVNGVLGFRMITSTKMYNTNISCIYEFISKPFIKNAKVGYVRNEKDYYDMTQCEESQIGVVGVGDKSGYTIKYQNTSDTTPANIIVNKYGLKG